MNIRYDLHIHSALSPLATSEMNIQNIFAKASLEGIKLMAITDINSILNVAVAMEMGELLGITIVPAVEIQTQEDIHFLCYFKTYENLKNFFNSIEFPNILNDEQVFGEQVVYNNDGDIVDYERRMLLVGANISADDILMRARAYDGVALPSHVENPCFGIVKVFGEIGAFPSIELTTDDTTMLARYIQKYNVLMNSNAKELEDIGKYDSTITLRKNTAEALVNFLRGNDVY